IAIAQGNESRLGMQVQKCREMACDAGIMRIRQPHLPERYTGSALWSVFWSTSGEEALQDEGLNFSAAQVRGQSSADKPAALRHDSDPELFRGLFAKQGFFGQARSLDQVGPLHGAKPSSSCLQPLLGAAA